MTIINLDLLTPTLTVCQFCHFDHHLRRSAASTDPSADHGAPLNQRKYVRPV
jgi:hypothetical protein